MREFPPEPADYCGEVHPIYQLRCLRAAGPHTVHHAYRRETARCVYWSVRQMEQPTIG